jgi:Signal transduction histidine kinase regulating C4-dicarboxylate transport system
MELFSSGEPLSSMSLRYLLILRVIAIAGGVIMMAVMATELIRPLLLIPGAAILAALGVFNLWSWHYLARVQAVSEHMFLVQLLVDVTVLTVLLYFTGGSTNPLVSLFLLPITVAAAILRPFYTWLIAGIAVICYTVLMFIYVPLAHHTNGNSDFALHVWGMWFGFVLITTLVACFVRKIGDTLRERDWMLALAREESLRAERVLALGTLAAGTAHELGTPLATVAVLAKELEHDHQELPDLVDRLRLLRQQVDRCKKILARISSQAGQVQADSGHRVTLDRYLKAIIAEWRATRPDVRVHYHWQGCPAVQIVADRTLTQAITNVLNNAADASSESVEVEGSWSKDILQIGVRDQGRGLSAATEAKVGQPFFTTKKPGEGLGLGLFLAETALKRFGGSIRLINRSEGGVCAEITLPLSPLSVTE